MRATPALLLLALCLPGMGCGLLSTATHNVASGTSRYLDNRNEQRLYEGWADQAWVRAATGSPTIHSTDYAAGFKDGFVDHLARGGQGDPPAVPPRCYWKSEYQTPTGHRAIEDWYAGFRAGAGAALASGYRQYVVLPSARPPVAALPPAAPMLVPQPVPKPANEIKPMPKTGDEPETAPPPRAVSLPPPKPLGGGVVAQAQELPVAVAQVAGEEDETSSVLPPGARVPQGPTKPGQIRFVEEGDEGAATVLPPVAPPAAPPPPSPLDIARASLPRDEPPGPVQPTARIRFGLVPRSPAEPVADPPGPPADPNVHELPVAITPTGTVPRGTERQASGAAGDAKPTPSGER